MCLAQGHNAVTPVRLELVAPRCRVKHSTTEPLPSPQVSLVDFILYNQETTNLAFHYYETSKDKLSILQNWLSIILIQVHAKLHENLFISTCSLHWNIKSSWEVCENLSYGEKHSFIEWTYVVGAHWNCLYEAIPMCTNNIYYWN